MSNCLNRRPIAMKTEHGQGHKREHLIGTGLVHYHRGREYSATQTDRQTLEWYLRLLHPEPLAERKPGPGMAFESSKPSPTDILPPRRHTT